jgi:hypothetical protein
MGPMTMIVRPSSGPSAGTVGSADCAYARILMGRRCRSTYTSTLKKKPSVTRMNGRATTDSIVCISRCVTVRKNGPAMTMGMASGRCIPTRSKGCGQPRAISCVRFGASTKNICTAIWPCASIKSISNVSVRRLLLDSSLSTDQ